MVKQVTAYLSEDGFIYASKEAAETADLRERYWTLLRTSPLLDCDGEPFIGADRDCLMLDWILENWGEIQRIVANAARIGYPPISEEAAQ